MKDERETADELFRHRDEPGEWEERPEEITVKRARSEVVSFRMPRREMDVLEEAVKASGGSLSEFLRGAIALRLRGAQPEPSLEVSSGASRLVVRGNVTRGRREASGSVVPDHPPMRITAAGDHAVS